MAHKDIVDRGQVARIAEQIGTTLMPDNAVWKNRFTVDSSSSSAVYTIAQRRTDGVWGCSCPAWRHRRKCKHLVDVLSRLAKVAATVQAGLDADVLAMLKSARTAYLDLDAVAPVAAPKVKGRDLDL